MSYAEEQGHGPAGRLGQERVLARQRKREPWRALEKGSNKSRGLPSEVILRLREEGLRVGKGGERRTRTACEGAAGTGPGQGKWGPTSDLSPHLASVLMARLAAGHGHRSPSRGEGTAMSWANPRTRWVPCPPEGQQQALCGRDLPARSHSKWVYSAQNSLLSPFHRWEH